MVFEYDGKLTKTEQESIENSIGTIASTPYGTVPFMRDFGIKNYMVDTEIEKNQYATEVMTQCMQWEDRVQVSEIHFTENNEVRMVLTDGED